jgi:hypothetical protein
MREAESGPWRRFVATRRNLRNRRHGGLEIDGLIGLAIVMYRDANEASDYTAGEQIVQLRMIERCVILFSSEK